jgi:hypothetical protein
MGAQARGYYTNLHRDGQRPRRQPYHDAAPPGRDTCATAAVRRQRRRTALGPRLTS